MYSDAIPSPTNRFLQISTCTWRMGGVVLEPNILVDDSNPAIQYAEGQWTPMSTYNLSNLGDSVRSYTPMFDTLHVISLFNGSLYYNFTGIGASVIFVSVGITRKYTAQCFLNGILLNSTSGNTNVGQSQTLCQVFGLLDNMTHSISVSLSVPPLDEDSSAGDDSLSGIALDYILIRPSEQTTMGEDDLFLSLLDVDGPRESNDSSSPRGFVIDSNQAATSSKGWQFDMSNGLQTSTSGSEFNLLFTGISVWWYGYLTRNMSLLPSEATFAMDGGPPTKFNALPIASDFIATQPNTSRLFLFKTPNVGYGNHNLTVVHHGTNETMPLTLGAFIIKRSSLAVSTSPPSTSTMLSISSSSISMSSHPTCLTTGKHIPAGIYSGSIAGGLIFLFASILGCYFLTRRRRRRQKQSRIISPENVNVVPEPFPAATEDMDVIGPRKGRRGRPNIEIQELDPPQTTKWTRLSRPLARNYDLSEALAPGAQETDVRGLNTDTAPDEHSSPIQPAAPITVYPQIREDPHHNTDDVASPVATAEAHGVREEDSGLRLAQEGDTRPPVLLLPPLYTTH
ncbi:hypothetical protein D9619_000009 [Psilocybe cf. subviscida]|uniref:Uncharacterized protein n=1 Tax=Psilocybe cf. subviscida TaxID=2480587 RepID=A0A8H5BD79_9AGAR|nr:hypothetical protein D9619_000009 [Psilocybe cf. subviscida]